MKRRSTICIIQIALVFSQLAGCTNVKSATLKKTEFVFSVNHEISKRAADYFDNCNENDEIVFRKSDVNVKKIGHYQATIAYKERDYEIKIDVMDREKPVIKLKKDVFVIALHRDYKDVQEQLNKGIMVTDNYDTVFPKFSLLKKMPMEEKEILYPIQVKDTSGNASDVVTLRVQFTKDGKAKSGLKQETNDVEVIVNKAIDERTSNQIDNVVKKENSIKEKSDKETIDLSDKQPSDGVNHNTEAHTDSNTNQGNDNGANKPLEKPNKPVESVEPPRPNEQPKPEQPLPKPLLTVANCPDYLKDGYAKLFATEDEAYTWWNEQVTTEGSPYYGMKGSIDSRADPYFTGILWGVMFFN